jgi:hypothetical protein
MAWWRTFIFLCVMPLFAAMHVQAAENPAPAQVRAFGADSLAAIAAAGKGKPFVLVIWSLDCEYCQASLAFLSREKNRHADLRLVTLSTDALNDPQTVALVRDRLAALGLTGDAWAFGSAPPEQLRYAIDPQWHGEMPRSYWFNARGERIAYSGVINDEVVRKMLSARHEGAN